MASMDVATGTIFLSQTVFGTLGNFSLLYHYLFLYSTEHRLRPTDLILKHLMIANSLALLSKGVPQTMTAFGFKDFLNEAGCKLVFYLHRIGRGMSMSSICLLSVFQAIMISPRDSTQAELKLKAPKHTGSFVFLCWILAMLTNISFPVNVTGKWSDANITMKKDLGYCSGVGNNKLMLSVLAAMLSFPDVLCLGLMIWASGSMVSILHRHKQRVRYIRGNKLSARCSPESTATQRILVLVSIFVSFYTLSSTFQLCIALINNPSWLLVNISAFVSGCFPTVSPYVLINHGSSLSKLCFVWPRNKIS
ncbi:vomeronasal type-1 receptor 4 [Panthera onca]